MTRPSSPSRRTPAYSDAVAPRRAGGTGVAAGSAPSPLDDVVALGELVADGVVLLDAAGQVEYANPAAAHLMGAASTAALQGQDALAALRAAGQGSAALALKGAVRSAHVRAPHAAGFTVHDAGGAPLVHGRVTARGDGTLVVLQRAESAGHGGGAGTSGVGTGGGESEALAAIVRHLAGAEDAAAQVLDQLATSARALLGAEGACVVTLDADGGGLIEGSAGTLGSMRGHRTELLATPSPMRRALDERRVVIDNEGARGRGAGAMGPGVRHLVVAPILVAGEGAAVLCAVNSARGGFTGHDGDLAARLADHGALAVRGHRLHVAATRGARTMRVLGEAARVLAGSEPRDAVHAALGRLAREAFGASGVAVTLVDPSSGRVTRVHGEGAGDAAFSACDVTAFWNSARGRAVRDALPAYVDGTIADRPTVVDRAIGRALELDGVRAFALLPFAAGGTRGLLALLFPDARTFDDGDRALLAVFATHVAAAMRGAGIGDADARDRDRLRATAEIARAALDAPDVAAGAGAVLAVLDRWVPSLGKALCAHRSDEPIAECLAASGSMAQLCGLRVPCAPPAPTRGADRLPEAVVVPDVRTALGAAFRGRAAAESAVMVPLVARGATIGDLSVTTRLGAPLAGDALETLRTLATPVALALDALLAGNASRVQREEQRRTDEQLRQTEKMAALGELVAGVAHEINNPLTGISAFAEMLLDERLTDDQRESARLIKREADRAVNVVRDLLAFSRKTEPTYESLDLNALLERTLRLRAYALRAAGVEVSLTLAADLPLAHGDGAKLQQVLLNLLLNAEYAMRDSSVRRLDASTRRSGDRLVLAIADTGCGITPDVLPRVFEPFFTTKPAGDGTGLGLSVSYGIVQAHGGQLRARSVPQLGTTFELVLPSHPGASLGAPSSSPQS